MELGGRVPGVAASGNQQAERVELLLYDQPLGPWTRLRTGKPILTASSGAAAASTIQREAAAPLH